MRRDAEGPSEAQAELVTDVRKDYVDQMQKMHIKVDLLEAQLRRMTNEPRPSDFNRCYEGHFGRDCPERAMKLAKREAQAAKASAMSEVAKKEKWDPGSVCRNSATLPATFRERRETRDVCGAAECEQGGAVAERNTKTKARDDWQNETNENDEYERKRTKEKATNHTHTRLSTSGACRKVMQRSRSTTWGQALSRSTSRRS